MPGIPGMPAPGMPVTGKLGPGMSVPGILVPGVPGLGIHVEVCLSRYACSWHACLQYSCPWYAASPPIVGTESAVHPIHTMRSNPYLCFFSLNLFFFETLGPCLSVLVTKLKCLGAF